jgi:hypothetical protein
MPAVIVDWFIEFGFGLVRVSSKSSGRWMPVKRVKSDGIWKMAKKKPPTENPVLLERGQKQRSGRMLSEYLRAIGQECTEVVIPDSPAGCPAEMPRLVSKAEAMARWLWRRALASKADDGTYVPPDLDVVKIVLDRCEGKPGVQGEEKADGRETVPDKVSRMNRDRLNAMAEGDEA